MATISDVAKKAGVSTTLVSRYLNQVKGVSAASKEKIESAIRELQYVPDESARMLVRRRGGSPAALPQRTAAPALPAAAMICTGVDFDLLSPLYEGFRHAVRTQETENGMTVLLLPLAEDETRDADRETVCRYTEKSCKLLVCFCEEADENLRSQLQHTAETLPVLLVTPEEPKTALTIGSEACEEEKKALKARAETFAKTLLAAMDKEEHFLKEEHLPFSLVLNREADDSTRSRSLQSHLL